MADAGSRLVWHLRFYLAEDVVHLSYVGLVGSVMDTDERSIVSSNPHPDPLLFISSVQRTLLTQYRLLFFTHYKTQ